MFVIDLDTYAVFDILGSYILLVTLQDWQVLSITNTQSDEVSNIKLACDF
jgi:hypothetical protein